MRFSLRDRKTKLLVRAAFVLVLVPSVALLAHGQISILTDKAVTNARYAGDTSTAIANQEITVVTTQGLKKRGVFQQPGDSPGEIVAVTEDKEVVYYNNSHHSYYDVDEVPGTRATVQYVAAEYRTPEECGISTPCWTNLIETVNLSTGETRRIHSETNGVTSTIQGAPNWHDVDKYDGSSFVVADIATDSVFVLNTTTNAVEWGWRASSDYPVSYGGQYARKAWTHLNDVEVLPDRRVMVSLRNQDQVVFLDPEKGLQESWTLGAPEDHATLKLQHNPDYIPAERGGPAVIVADSRNDRIVEYQRVGGDWEQSWVYRDSQMRWPRDADRLPGGRTLITDTNSDRVFEISRANEILWQINLTRPYDAERLGTGDESGSGTSASELGLSGYRRGSDSGSSSGVGGPLGVVQPLIDAVVPDTVARAAFFVAPAWMDYPHLVAVGAVIGSLLSWPPLELYWSSYGIRLRLPIKLDR